MTTARPGHGHLASRPRRQPWSAELVAASVVWLVSVLGAALLVWQFLPLALVDGSPAASELSIVLLAPVFVVFASLGWLLVRRLPGHRVGWLLLWTPPAGVAAFGGIAVGQQLASTDPALAGAIGTLGVTMLIPFLLLPLTALPLLFPDGRLPGRGWRLPVGILVSLVAGAVIALGFTPGQVDPGVPPNPFAIPFLPPEVRLLGTPLSVGALLLAAVLGIGSVAVRFRRGGDERQQVKWLLAAVLLITITGLPGFIGIDSDLLSLLGPIALALLPLAVTIAILRYRLYDIDHLVSRTVTYLLVTAGLVAVFVVGNLALQAILAGITAGNTLAVAASTLLALAVAQPLRRRIQARVDHRFDRARVDAARAAAAFAARQRDQVNLGAILHDVGTTASATLRPASIAIWLRDPASTAQARAAVAAWPASQGGRATTKRDADVP